jgi:hypothetical protein
MGMVETLPKASGFFENKIKRMQIVGCIGKLVVVKMVLCLPNHAFLGVRRKEGHEAR